LVTVHTHWHNNRPGVTGSSGNDLENLRTLDNLVDFASEQRQIVIVSSLLNAIRSKYQFIAAPLFSERPHPLEPPHADDG
jgi:hypothetical protein